MSVFITNLDDYISPSQACINPFVLTKDPNINNINKSNKKIVIENETIDINNNTNQTVRPNLIKAVQKDNNTSKIASVSLNDCLACSGCITTAEAILIEDQSYNKLINKIRDNDSIIIISISSQCLASIGSLVDISLYELFLKISAFFKSLGVNYVFDMSSVGDVALLESAEEFIHRYNQERTNEWISPPNTIAISSNKIKQLNDSNIYDNQSNINEIYVETPEIYKHLPMLASNCPGWICYAEKNQPQSLPYISTTKSPQQILGTLVKSLLREKLLSYHSYDNIYIVSIQPCFDKKLEASRNDFYHDDNKYNEIDLVLSTTELWNLIEEQSNQLSVNPVSYIKSFPLDNPNGSNEIEELFRSCSIQGNQFISSMYSESNGGSGGYADFLLRYCSEKLLDINIWDDKLIYNPGRNIDISDISISNNNKSLKFARAYGFRNIQSIMLKMKKKKCEYDFIEIMACPSGCLNGGGQIKEIDNKKDRLTNISTIYYSNHIFSHPSDSKLVKYIYSHEYLQSPMSRQALQLLHTRYHAVPKLETYAPLAVKW